MSRRKSKKAHPTEFKLPVRNPVAANPLLGKSQAHGKTRKADRRASKVSLKKMPFDRVTGTVEIAASVIGSNGILPLAAPLAAPSAALMAASLATKSHSPSLAA